MTTISENWFDATHSLQTILELSLNAANIPLGGESFISQPLARIVWECKDPTQRQLQSFRQVHQDPLPSMWAHHWRGNHELLAREDSNRSPGRLFVLVFDNLFFLHYSFCV